MRSGVASMEDEPSGFGRRLKHYRQAEGLTQAALAERVPCAPETIRKFEAGTRRPSYQMAERLAEILGLPPDERAIFVREARGRTVPPPTTGRPGGSANPMLLATKLYVPPPAPAVVPRARLLAQLDAGRG